jgi:NAD(P)-dependent dehydrogenase (short-subunit alcohol dehydrogenase family)
VSGGHLILVICLPGVSWRIREQVEAEHGRWVHPAIVGCGQVNSQRRESPGSGDDLSPASWQGWVRRTGSHGPYRGVPKIQGGCVMSAQAAIVAGGGGALGHATAAALAASGRTVVAIDRSEHALRELPDSVRPEVADTSDPAAAKGVIDRIASEVGPPDVLVNTIGTFQPGDALTTTPELLQLMIDVNLGPALWLSQAVAPHMQQQGSGAIVHVAARPGIEPSGGMAAYGVSKAALVHLTRILDIELRPHGIRVNAVAPQLLDTPTNRTLFPAEVIAHAVAPEAIAGVIAFLVSDAAAPVSGAILPAYGP